MLIGMKRQLQSASLTSIKEFRLRLWELIVCMRAAIKSAHKGEVNHAPRRPPPDPPTADVSLRLRLLAFAKYFTSLMPSISYFCFFILGVVILLELLEITSRRRELSALIYVCLPVHNFIIFRKHNFISVKSPPFGHIH